MPGKGFGKPELIPYCLRPRIKLETVLVHGRRGYVFAVPPDQEHGSNMTITVHNRVLVDMTTHGDQPRHLWLQLDNCGGENKNGPVMAYCGFLVARKIFETVTVAFLPVGHTHEDVDGFHAVHSRVLRVSDVFDVNGMLDVVRTSHTKYRDNVS